MELYQRIIDVIDVNLIFCLIPILLTLKVVELIFKDRFETRKALNVIRWIIVSYTIAIFTIYLIGMVTNPDEHAFINRATGPYAVTYWIMLLGALVLPLTLLHKNLASKFWYVLFVAFGMKSGMYFERFVIITTSFHRDYQTENGHAKLLESASHGIGVLFLQGILIAVLTLGILEITKRRKTRQHNGNSL